MNIYATKGDLVMYTGQHGLQSDREHAGRKGLVPGNIYTIATTKIYDYYTDVELLEVAGRFNSVMFEDYATADSSAVDCCTQPAPKAEQAITALPNENYPVRHEFFVQAILHTVVEADDEYGAVLDVKERLNDLIATGYAKHDPAHSALVTSVYEIPQLADVR